MARRMHQTLRDSFDYWSSAIGTIRWLKRIVYSNSVMIRLFETDIELCPD